MTFITRKLASMYMLTACLDQAAYKLCAQEVNEPGLTYHHHISHTKMGPRFKVSSEDQRSRAVCAGHGQFAFEVHKDQCVQQLVCPPSPYWFCVYRSSAH